MDWFINALDIGFLPKAVDKVAASAVNSFRENMGGGGGGAGGNRKPAYTVGGTN